jgi:hypothetical protein
MIPEYERRMPQFNVVFHELVQDSQEYGSDNEYMVSRVCFTLGKDGERIGDFSADLKQVVGSNAESGDIEVSSPHGYDGEFNHQGFSAAAIQYFRSLVGAAGRGIRIQGGSGMRMFRNKFTQEEEFNF